MNILKALSDTKLTSNGNGQACRMVSQGAVAVDGDLIRDPDYVLSEGRHILQMGRQKKDIIVTPFGGILVLKKELKEAAE